MAAPVKQPITLYSTEYFAACGVGGILSCGLTHWAVTPLDVVKCNLQANPQVFKSTAQGFSAIMKGTPEVLELGFRPGLAGICTGWAPTLVGYSIQGLCKFGFYEYFKWFFAQKVGEERAYKYRDLVYMSASASAEFIADIAYCPFEAVKVRMQTNPKFASGMMSGMSKIISQEGFGNLYAGLTPLWARQIPYTIIKFMAFERIAEWLFGLMPKPKEKMNSVEQLGVIFAAGYMAGVMCGIVSHPADVLVSKINKLKMEGSFLQKTKVIYSGSSDGSTKGIGFKGLWGGLAPRVVMIGTLTGLQWFIYGAFKRAIGLPAPGGAAKKH